MVEVEEETVGVELVGFPQNEGELVDVDLSRVVDLDVHLAPLLPLPNHHFYSYIRQSLVVKHYK